MKYMLKQLHKDIERAMNKSLGDRIPCLRYNGQWIPIKWNNLFFLTPAKLETEQAIDALEKK